MQRWHLLNKGGLKGKEKEREERKQRKKEENKKKKKEKRVKKYICMVLALVRQKESKKMVLTSLHFWRVSH